MKKLHIPECTTPPMDRVKPAKVAETEFITIPMAEYSYLRRLDVLMDVLLLDSSCGGSPTIQTVKNMVLDYKMAAKAEG